MSRRKAGTAGAALSSSKGRLAADSCDRGMAPFTTKPAHNNPSRVCSFAPYSRNTLSLHTKMTTTFIPIHEDAYERSNLLFSLKQASALPCREVEKYWPLVNTVYAKIGGLVSQQKGTVGECRSRKVRSGASSTVTNPNGIKKEQYATLNNARCKPKRAPSPQTQQSQLLQLNG